MSLLLLQPIHWNQRNGIGPILYNRHTYRYRLFRLTQHFYCYFLTLRISIEDDRHL